MAVPDGFWTDDLEATKGRMNQNLLQPDIAANRPASAAATKHMLFYATDTGAISYDDGAAWQIVRDGDVSQAQIEAGSDTAIRGMTALRIKQASVLSNIAKHFVEDGIYKCLYTLGGANDLTIATNGAVGLGFTREGSGTFAKSSVIKGGWSALCGTTSADAIHIQGPNAILAAAEDWHLIARFQIPNEGSRNVVFGLTDANDPADVNNMIAWTVSGTGNYIGKVDNAGTETTRDSGTASTDNIEHTFRIEISGGGTTVKFFFDGSQVGADVTTNIPSSTSMYLLLGVKTAENAAKTVHMADVFAFREV